MDNQINIAVIPHTHWDKEWYFTAARSLLYSLKDFDEILGVLEKDTDFRVFHLDGQLSIIEEYLELHPEKKDLLTRLVQEGKLIIGPWYTQPDTLVICGESLIKNLEIGILESRKYGSHQSIGYLPDSFGMSSQLPQIYRSFELEFAFFRRGIARHLVDNREFIWKSLDGTGIFTHNLHHYGNMAYPPNNQKELIDYFRKIVDQLTKSSHSSTVLLFNGEDQKPIRKNLPELIRIGNEHTPYSIMMQSLEEVLRNLEKEYQMKDLLLPEYQGEFTFGQYSRTHKSIFSTRADLKQLNNHLENYLTNIVEPVSALAFQLGFSYEQVLLDKIWKLMLLNSAHDSIGNCNSDATNEDIKHRYIAARRLSEELVDLKLREIGMGVVQHDITQFQLYNLLPTIRTSSLQIEIYSPYRSFSLLDSNHVQAPFIVNEIEDVTENYLKKSLKEIGVNNEEHSHWQESISKLYKVNITILAKNLPAFGYATYRLENIPVEDLYYSEPNSRLSEISNNRYIIRYQNGELILVDKLNEQVISNFITLLDDGDEGDSYDYSEPLNDRKIYVDFHDYHTVHTELYKELVLKGTLTLPKNLEERTMQQTSVLQEVTVAIRLNQYEAEEAFMRVEVQTVNLAEEHRLRLVVNTGRNNPFSYSDVQFGTIRRPTYLPQIEKWREEKWDEKPRTIEPLLTFVTNGFEKGAIQVVTEDVREYQFIGEEYDQIAMTFYRSTPYLGKADLQDRPGRESGTKAVTEGTRFYQEKVSSCYYIQVLTEDDNEYTCVQVAKSIVTPVIGYQASPYRNNTDTFILSKAENETLPLNYSLFSLQDTAIVSVVKKARTNNMLQLRVYNPSMNSSLDVNLADVSKIISPKQLVNCLEKEQESESLHYVKLAPCQFQTILFTNSQG